MRQRAITFTITEIAGAPAFTVRALVTVPDGWEAMPADAQREYLVRPRGDHLHYATPFQEATGIDFETEPIKHERS